MTNEQTKNWENELKNMHFYSGYPELLIFFISQLLERQRKEVLDEVEKDIKNHLKKEVVCSKKCLIDNVINKLK